MSINFLLQIIRILHVGDYDETDVQMIYDYLRKMDYETLINYYNSNSVLSYNNDLEVCIEIMDKILYILETKEEYEKCQIIKDKKDQSKDIITNNITIYESTTNVGRRKEKNTTKSRRT